MLLETASSTAACHRAFPDRHFFFCAPPIFEVHTAHRTKNKSHIDMVVVERHTQEEFFDGGVITLTR